MIWEPRCLAQVEGESFDPPSFWLSFCRVILLYTAFCGTFFEAKRQKDGPRFCSARCRGVAWRARRVRDLAEILDDIEEALQKARKLFARWGEG